MLLSFETMPKLFKVFAALIFLLSTQQCIVPQSTGVQSLQVTYTNWPTLVQIFLFFLPECPSRVRLFLLGNASAGPGPQNLG